MLPTPPGLVFNKIGAQTVGVTLAFPVIVKIVGFDDAFEKVPPLPVHPEKTRGGGRVAVTLTAVFAVYPEEQFLAVFTVTYPMNCGT